MRKYVVIVASIAALAIPAAALSVSLHNGQGTTCPYGGDFHFVANGVKGEVGALTATFSGGGSVSGLVSTKYNQGTNHWWITGTGTLESASATKGKMLVLSDYSCYSKKS